MKVLSCCFTGHRKIPEEEIEPLLNSLSDAISRAISAEYTHFFCGGAMGFDTMAAKEVLRQREIHPQIRLYLLLPHKGQESRWSSADQMEYHRILGEADAYFYTAEEYSSGCLHLRNRMLVINADVCIHYVREKSGGSAYTMKYAQTLGKKLFPL